ncbi:MAG TPA: hypothetical protein VMI52_09005, partial [Acetobacteraceae bacterium]|nr:hypothetical protein [Acetobacteraceae bacterium]
MIEAYEIGISLALDDGIAEGVAAARRELMALDAAMTASTDGMRRLRAGRDAAGRGAEGRGAGGAERGVQGRDPGRDPGLDFGR